MDRNLIVNADDFGASAGINRGIIECHADGVLTSASLMVLGQAAEEATAASRKHPTLSVGLHFDGDHLHEPDPASVGSELARQLDIFERLMGRPPTHIDAHHHAHREEQVAPFFREAADRLGVPLRDDGAVGYVGGFYAQWEWRVTELRYVSVEFLQQLLREEVPEGWTEIACHPGYVDPAYATAYDQEREAEVRTLTDPRVRETIDKLGIQLVSYADRATSSRLGSASDRS